MYLYCTPAMLVLSDTGIYKLPNAKVPDELYDILPICMKIDKLVSISHEWIRLR
jgi:hypothetical protein